MKLFKVEHAVAAPGALIGASNFFELAVVQDRMERNLRLSLMNLVTNIGITLFVITLTAIYASPASYPGVGRQAESSQDGGTTDFVLIITGGELLRGLYADSHTQFITRTLVPLGCRCVASLCVGDKRRDLKDALVYAKQHAPLIIVTGGLGPTADDITREVVAELTGIRLREHPEALADLEKRFAGSGRELRGNLRRQALTPVKGTYLPNPSGTAVGLVFDTDEQVLVALPGPPRELRPMLSNELVPYLSKRFGIRSIGSSLQMRFVGIGESSIDQAIQDHLTLPEDLVISSLFEQGRVDLTFSLPGDTETDEARLRDLERQLMPHIGEYMYSDDGSTLEEQVVKLLAENQLTLALAEVGSGGAVAASLSDIKDVSLHVLGGVVSTSDANMASALKVPVPKFAQRSPMDDSQAKAMANRVRESLGSRWGLAVTEPHVSGDGRSFVWLALSKQEKGFSSRRIYLRGQGQTMRNRLVSSVLDSIRKEFLEEKQSRD